MVLITKDEGKRELPFDHDRFVRYVNGLGINDEEFVSKVVDIIMTYDKFPAREIPELIIKTALENVDIDSPEWTFVASRVMLTVLYKEASINRRTSRDRKYGDYLELVKLLVGKGIYSPELLEAYTEEELKVAGELIVPERDELFTYPGLRTLATRYLAVDGDKNVYELPQERWVTIALWLMKEEDKEHRMALVEEAYWALSNLYMTVATPTLSNSGKVHAQLSSCFIDTVEDDLRSIYDSNTDVATLSKHGGGIGVYLGKVRSRGSSIRGHKGVASGTIPWIRQLNNTAYSVDQLGVRRGAVAIYQDIWHKDIMAHLDLKLNNGDERERAHDIFPAVTIPDLFMETLEEKGDWYLFDPKEVYDVTGVKMEDLYDEEFGRGSFRDFYITCVKDPRIAKTKVPALDIYKRILRSMLETGTPFFFFRDTVNRANPNKHEGMIYCSNLCTEIAQNMSPTELVEEKVVKMDMGNGVDEDIIVTHKKPGDFVVCNLSSINLGRTMDDEEVLSRLIAIQVRMLDNVVDINEIPVPQASLNSKKYRAVGLGTFGWHHFLAKKGVLWESQQAVDLTDTIYEKIAYHTIKASADLAKEKGAYSMFEGSDWQNGDYFTRRGYFGGTDETVQEGSMTDKWKQLYKQIKEHGIRNGYLMAVAPNASTSVIAGSTASIDPIFKVKYYEEKKDARYPVVAPDLDHNTYNIFRKGAYQTDQRWSVEQNIARQRHIDQAISFNIYVPNTINVGILRDIHFQAWRGGVKTFYYLRSTGVEIEDCEWCES